jgi:ABC-type multidrug transport system ATPase subunit
VSLSIELNGVSRKYGREWIFRRLEKTFAAGGRYAVIGPNGSGKSTLLKVIAGILSPNEGKVVFKDGDKEVDIADVYKHISLCSPYLELPDELTLTELLQFHTDLRKLTISNTEFIQQVQLDPAKELRNYSSGMKQRLKLALAFYTESDLLLLDEPTANLDKHWSDWYLQLLLNQTGNRTLIISSNIPEEYSVCNDVVNVMDYK